MAVVDSGHIKLLDIATEFEDTQPYKLSEFYDGAGLVSDASIPSSGLIKISNFYGITSQSIGTLVASANNVNEGSTVTFTLAVTGYANGYTFPYTITGIQAGDISQGLTGVMTVSGNSATVDITATADLTTEGVQTMTFTSQGQSVNVTINDTSTTPAVTASNRGHYTRTLTSNVNTYSWNVNIGNPIGSGDFVVVGAAWFADRANCIMGLGTKIGSYATRYQGARYDTNSRYRAGIFYWQVGNTSGTQTITLSTSPYGNFSKAHIGVYRIGASSGMNTSPVRVEDQTYTSSVTLAHSVDDFVLAACAVGSNNGWGTWGGTLGNNLSLSSPWGSGYQFLSGNYNSDIRADITTTSGNGTITYSKTSDLVAVRFTHN